MPKEKNVIVGFDVGGAHLKAARVEAGCVVKAATYLMPLWQGLDKLTIAFGQAAELCAGADVAIFTMTGELSDVFASREEGVRALLKLIVQNVPIAEKQVYAGRAGLLGMETAGDAFAEVASANWHATAALVGKLAGEALFVDMGSTTTDIIPVSGGKVTSAGYNDAERLATGELVYTGFTRTFLFGVASSALVKGAFSPLMNEYFAAMADVHRILGVLDETDDLQATADGKAKTIAASTARLARMVGRDADELSAREWRDVAAWFSEQQLRTMHDAAIRVSANVDDDAPIVAAGIGRWQIRRLAERMDRRFFDFADMIPAEDAMRREAANAAAATAVALLAAV